MKTNYQDSWWSCIVVCCTLLLIVGCQSKVKPRKPISNTTNTYLKESIAINKKRVQKEEALIEEHIKKEALDYQRSAHGFYYRLFAVDSLDTSAKVGFGDRVTFNYDLTHLDGTSIYATSDLSPLTKTMEQEYGIFKGMREALKLMQVGDSMVAYFPSHTAYGYYGDKDQIGANTPVKSHIKLLDVNGKNINTQN